MFKRVFLVSLLSLSSLLAHDDKETNAKANTSATAKEESYIQVDAKKSKKYEIYTLEGTYVTDGILDFNARANVSDLKPGNYLLVIGKKAYQFNIQ